MNNDPLGGMPVSKIYKIALHNIQRKVEREGKVFEINKAIRLLAEVHADKLKDLIDENMTSYDKKRLADIVERCVARYIKLED